jgi:hypothetical protein
LPRYFLFTKDPGRISYNEDVAALRVVDAKAFTVLRQKVSCEGLSYTRVLINELFSVLFLAPPALSSKLQGGHANVETGS